jgi:endo-1,4-beta-xylanase
MKIKYLIYGASLAILTGFAACKKAPNDGAFVNDGNFTDTTGTLKAVATFPIGLSLEYQPSLNDAKYWNTAAREVNSITFGNELKNDAVVRADGSYDFTVADAFLAKATSAGLEVFGHTLVWHSQQRASYYNSLIGGGSAGGGAPNLVANPGFETTPGSNGDIAEGWQILNGATQFSIVSNNVNGGSKALQAVVPAGGQSYNTQIVTRAPIPVTAGKTYTISYFIKGTTAQNVQFEVRPTGGGSIDYQGGKPVTAVYTKVTYDYTVPAGATSLQFAFDLGGTANTIYIDDVSITETNYVAPSSNLVVNPGFEVTPGASGDIAEGWQSLNGATQFAIAAASNANSGSKALQANVPAGGQNYNTQIITRALIPVTAGKKYNISYFIKGASAQNIQFEVRPTGGGSIDYQGGKPVTTAYTKINYEYTVPAGATAIQLAFDLGGTANTIYIDDVTIADASIVPPPAGPALATIVDGAMKKHIETVVGRYKGKIKAWDVLNEPFTNGGGALRDNSNTTGAGVFVWQHYLGRGFAEKAFKYAKAVDPAALMFMNDFNLEIDPTKLDAFVKLANELKAANAGIDGVGTQMHISVNTPYAGIINMMRALASTGLKVRISELDVKINPDKAEGFTPRDIDYRNQAAMYKFVIDTYMKYVPAGQRHGVTIWGVDDTRTWLESADDKTKGKRVYPLIFDKDFKKKQAYSGVKQALQGK